MAPSLVGSSSSLLRHSLLALALLASAVNAQEVNLTLAEKENVDASNTNLTNYERQGISITYDKDGVYIPETGTLDGSVIELDGIPPNIELNKTEAFLKCDAGNMNIQLKFKTPFYGIVYADFDRNSACKISGNGKLEETILLPLKGCGTLQRPVRVFTNNIVVRFHPGLEIDGDEVITIVCRYPKPIVPLPAIPAPLIVPPSEVRTLQPLRELEILMIICAIIFLSLMLLGIGCSYYCLKKRNIKVVRRRPVSTLGSDITKVSEPPSLFDGLKIPRAHAVDASGSEEVTESIRTDFASEIASVISEEEYTSAYSDKMCVLAEGAVVSKLTDPPMPNFDMRVNVRNKEVAYTPAMSVASSDSELVLNAQEQYLTTILERTETNTKETLERIRAAKAKRGPPPVHARINVKNKVMSDTSDIESVSEISHDGTEQFSEQELELESRNLRGMVIDANQDNTFDVNIRHRRNQEQEYLAQRDHHLTSDSEYSVNDYNGGMNEHISTNYTGGQNYTTGGMSTGGQNYTGDMSTNRQDYSQNVTTSSTTVVDHMMDHRTDHRNTMVDHRTDHRGGNTTMDHRTDIRNTMGDHRSDQRNTMDFSQSELITPVILRRGQEEQQRRSSATHQSYGSHHTTGGRQMSNFDVLIRIVDEPTSAATAGAHHDRDDLSSVFTEEERTTIKQVLLEDVNVQHELKSTFYRQDFLTLRNNELIKDRVEPQKWDVLIRVLNTNDAAASAREGSSLTSQSYTGDVNEILRSGGMTNEGYAASEGVSTFVSQGGRSAADRSGTEITEYHHYSASTATASASGAQHAQMASSSAAQQQGSFGWFEDEEVVSAPRVKRN